MHTSKWILAPGPAYVMGRPDMCKHSKTENRNHYELLTMGDGWRKGKIGDKTIALCYKTLCQFDYFIICILCFVMNIIKFPTPPSSLLDPRLSPPFSQLLQPSGLCSTLPAWAAHPEFSAATAPAPTRLTASLS